MNLAIDPKMKLFFVSFFVLFFCSSIIVDGSNVHENLDNFRQTKLFVFGDSYVDTGNIRKSSVVSRNFPYGITFPGKPSGRFSDGRVATDFLAQLMGIKSPIPYAWKDYAGKERLQYGMNFAYGGTGVFMTRTPLPNMTTQIDFFQNLLIAGDIYSPSHLTSSVALVSVAGNDYSTFLALNRSLSEFPTFIKQVVGQTEVNLRRIQALGVKKIAVASLQPLGCLPHNTIVSSFHRCIDSENALVKLHNSLLQQVVAKLNNYETTKKSSFVVLDYYNTFLTIFNNKGAIDQGSSRRFETPLKPCCEGACGVVDNKGVNKKYTLCNDPKSAFFWDNLHPTQEGWRSVYSVLAKPITEFLKLA